VQQIARDWRELIAGSEGYLTDATRRGLFRQSVAWGEMVCYIWIYVSQVIWIYMLTQVLVFGNRIAW
jgi:hypothetical protein